MHITTNAPANLSYGTFVTQLIRYSRICTNKERFWAKVKQLVENMLQRGYCRNKLYKGLCRFFENYRVNLFKYGIVSKEQYAKEILMLL